MFVRSLKFVYYVWLCFCLYLYYGYTTLFFALEISEFELQSHYYVHVWINTFVNVIEPFFLLCKRLNTITADNFLKIYEFNLRLLTKVEWQLKKKTKNIQIRVFEMTNSFLSLVLLLYTQEILGIHWESISLIKVC